MKILAYLLSILLLVSNFSCKRPLPKNHEISKKDSLMNDSLKKRAATRGEMLKKKAFNKLNLILKTYELERLSASLTSKSDLTLFESDIIKFKRKNDSIFYSSEDLNGRQFNDDIRCIDTTFLEDLNLDKTIFFESLKLWGIKFEWDLTFLGAVFFKDVSFERLKIYNDFTFSEAIIPKNLVFKFCMVKGYADFTKAAFSENANFMGSNFYTKVSFKNARFKKNVYFNDVYLGHYANFSNLRLDDSTNFDFSGAMLPDTLDFSFNNGIKKNIDFSDANFTDSLHYNHKTDTYFKPHYINLYKSDISKFRLDYIHFRLVTDSVQKSESAKKEKIPKDEAESMYEALLNNFKSNGQMESYKLLDIEYQEYKWKNSAAAFWVFIPKYWWNFGYSKERVFVWTALFLLVFTLINFFCLGYLNDVYTLEKLGTITTFYSSRFTIKDSFLRMWFAFVYSSTIFFRLTLKVEAINYSKLLGTIYIILMYTIGLICLAYMANFVLQK